MFSIKNQSGKSAQRISESGNVLFLILIAVALFAALSYAVTQSSRSGSGQATSEKSLLSGAQITQYPAGVRTDIIRMMIDSNTSADQLEFNPPSAFGTNNANLTLNPSNKATRAVFHPDGGGAVYQAAPPDVMDNGAAGTWSFNAKFSVPNIGTTSTTDASGNELIAWLPGIKQAVCIKIDDALGIASNPVPTFDAVLTDVQDNQQSPGYTFPTTPGTPVVSTAGASLSGQPFACFQDTTTSPATYVYYHVLLER
jgi:hypothetical protein